MVLLLKKPKILFLKTLSKELKPTEHLALEVLNDPKYDDYPQYVDKEEIQRAFDEYGYKLNPFNAAIYANILNSPNIEGHFLAENLPEIDSVVIDDVCNVQNVQNILDKDDEITHIGLSTYANGLNKVVDVINMIQRDYPDKKIYTGGIGVLFPYIQKLIKPQNICIGNGINWLRKKFDLPTISREGFKMPTIISDQFSFLTNMKTAYMVSQIGCPFRCDFCITSAIYQYNPFSNHKKIIELLEKIMSSNDGDMILYLCEPNACFPERVWKKVFDYFIENKSRYNNYMYIICLISLSHLKTFNLKKIQEESAIKFMLVNYGIESTLQKYEKNKGLNNNFIRSLNDMGIITNHNFILGLPIHNKKTIEIDIQRNLEYDSLWYFISTLKPLPMTPLYEQLKSEGRIFGDDLPSEFVYHEGFFPFEHKNLGKGFSALKYAFKAYHETEKKILDVYSRFVEALLKSPVSTSSPYAKNLIRSLIKISEMNFELFKPRMESEMNKKYEIRLENCIVNARDLFQV